MSREAFQAWHGGRYRGTQEAIAWAAWLAAIADHTAHVREMVPPGYVLVPLEPTEAMVLSAAKAWEGERGLYSAFAAALRAGIAAAPAPAVPPYPDPNFDRCSAAAQPPVALTPLTDEQIVNAMCEDGCERIESFYHVGPVQKAAVWSFARAIEAAHGIAPGAKE